MADHPYMECAHRNGQGRRCTKPLGHDGQHADKTHVWIDISDTALVTKPFPTCDDPCLDCTENPMPCLCDCHEGPGTIGPDKSRVRCATILDPTACERDFGHDGPCAPVVEPEQTDGRHLVTGGRHAPRPVVEPEPDALERTIDRLACRDPKCGCNVEPEQPTCAEDNCGPNCGGSSGGCRCACHKTTNRVVDPFARLGGAGLIAAERQRQIQAEGYGPAHDDEHVDGELAIAAACYTLNGIDGFLRPSMAHDFPGPAWWPWGFAAWKPGDRVRELVKAGALIAAEIDRLERPDA